MKITTGGVCLAVLTAVAAPIAVHAQAVSCGSMILQTGPIIGGGNTTHMTTLNWAPAAQAGCQVQSIVATGSLDTYFSGAPDFASWAFGSLTGTVTDVDATPSPPVKVSGPLSVALDNGATSFTYSITTTVAYPGDFAAIDPTITATFTPDTPPPPPPPMPEPEAWVLMLLGVAGVGAKLRHSRRANTGAPSSRARPYALGVA